jgi:hypothetical protein
MGIRRDKDFIVRMTEEVAKMLAALMGFRKAKQPEVALEKLSESGADWLGMPKSLLDRLDVVSVARMLAEPVKMRLYARLLREEAEILAELNRDGAAPRARAMTLIAEAVRIGGPRSEDDEELALLRAG